MSFRRKNLNQSKQQQPISSNQKVTKYLSEVEEKISNELSQCTFNVNVKQKPFFGDEQEKEMEIQKIKRLRSQKQEIEEKLKNLSEMEKKYQLQIKSIVKKTYSRQKKLSRPKSELTKKDLIKFRQINQRHEKQQRQLKERMQYLEKKKYEDMQKENQQRKKLIDKINLEKQAQISKKLRQLISNREKRIKIKEIQAKKVTQVLNKKRLHDQLEENWVKKQKQQQRKIIEQREQLIRERKMDCKGLREHEKKYEQIMKQKRQETKKRREEMNGFHYVPKSYQSRFYTMAIEESEKSRIKMEEDKQIKKEKLLKMWEYGDIIKCNYTPKLRMRTENQQPVDKSKIKISLNPEQRKQIGHSYLKFSKLKANKTQRNQTQAFITTNPHQKSEQIMSGHKVRYQDYLTQSRKQKNKKGSANGPTFQSELKETKKIMDKSSFTQAEKLQQLRMLAERMDSKSYSTKSSVLLKKITAKMEIIGALNRE